MPKHCQTRIISVTSYIWQDRGTRRGNIPMAERCDLETGFFNCVFECMILRGFWCVLG